MGSGVTRRRGAVTALALLTVGEAAASGAGRVQALRGGATAEAGGRRRDLAPAMPVFEGDLVSTAEEARLLLRLGEATELRLGGGVALRIDRFLARTGGVLVLERGAMLLDRPNPGGGAPGLAVHSPFGLIAVRGTRFFAGPSNGVFGTFVERGLVTLIGADQAVEITAGLGADIAAPGAPPTAPRSWGEARIRAALDAVG
jgi:hypothetical protein